jgi:hypothetical protein
VSVAFSDLVLLRLFVASYAPLAVMLAVQNSRDVWLPTGHLDFWVPAVVGLVGLVEAFRLPRGALRKSAARVNFTDVTEESSQVAAYVATYLLPFLGLNFIAWRDWVVIAVYLAVLLVVFVRSDLALVNPALYLMRWKVVSAHQNGRRVLVLVPSTAKTSAGSWSVVAFGHFYILKGTN